jgi:hypothetical protein
MTHTIRLDTTIPESRRVEFVLPNDVPPGEAELVLVVVPKQEPRASTGLDLLNSELFGMWAEREDLGDSADFAREQRDRLWRRSE